MRIFNRIGASAAGRRRAQFGPVLEVTPALRKEIEQPPLWMYAWELGEDLITPVLGPELPDIHRTRLELMEGSVRAALTAAGPRATVIDLACNEGWFSHRLLEWGASRVVGVDIRPQVIRRAELLRDHFGISPERLELRCLDVFDVDVLAPETFDIVLCLGLVYHLENPIGAIRIAHALTRGVCVIESQLTQQTDPIVHGNGQSNQYEEQLASFAALVETDYKSNMLASAGGVMSLIPNRAALTLAVEAAGFKKLELARPKPSHNSQYVLGDRAVMLAWPQACARDA
jgi:tRNA (mo5U34)-methyltransferase